MLFKLNRTTFDKIEVGQYFYKVDDNNKLVCFKKLLFEKAINTDDDSVNSFCRWSGVFLDFKDK
jgi:hypothetical protein